MIIDNKSYTGDGSTRQYATSAIILSNSHIAVFLDNVLQPTNSYDLLGSVVLFKIAPSNGVAINFVVSDTGEDLPVTPNELTTIYANITEIQNINAVIDEILNVEAIKTEIVDVDGLSTEIVDLYNNRLAILGVYAINTDISSLNSIKAKLESLYADKTTLDSLYADKDTLDSLYADKLVLDTLYAMKTKLDSIYADKVKLDSIYADKTQLDAIYANLNSLIDIYNNIDALLSLSATDPSFDSVTFNGGLLGEGKLSWNDTDKTLDLTCDEDVTLQLGQELFVRGKNTTGTTITNGTVLMVTGAVGNSGVITFGRHTGLKSDSHKIAGIATEDITNNSIGFSLLRGKIRGINCTGTPYGETWNEGDRLYVGTNGSLTNIEPIAGNLNMMVGIVVNNTINGTIQVRTTGIDEDISSNDVYYDNTNSKWSYNTVKEVLDETSSVINNHISLSTVTAYHIYNGSVEATNTILTNGFSTTLYTGNGGTQSINTGIDMATQWGDDASEMFGGLVWIKSRSATTSHMIFDTIRGAGARLESNSTNNEYTTLNLLSSFNANGFSVGIDGVVNTSSAIYASWNFQTTHRKTGVTNHGKAYTEHYNPFTGFTIIKYEGSGLAGHEIPHSLGRKLGFATIKNLSTATNWHTGLPAIGNNVYLYLNLTNAQSTDGQNAYTENSYISTASSDTNASTNQYILYGWANSYFDEDNTLIGNYEIGVYQGTGASGNKVTTRGKPAWLMVKRLDIADYWFVVDNQRSSFDSYVQANTSTAEVSQDHLDVFSDGFVLKSQSAGSNASGGQYLYMMVYDNDSGSGKSKYPKATDTTNLSINALVPYANGIDVNGSKVSIEYKNETITGLTLTQGKNYVYSKNDGTYGSSSIAPSYGTENPLTGDFFNLKTLKWYDSTNAEITPRTYLDCVVYADQNGQVSYIEELPKIQYVDKLKVDKIYAESIIQNYTTYDKTMERFSGIDYINYTNNILYFHVLSSDGGSANGVSMYVDGKRFSYNRTDYSAGSSCVPVPPGSKYSAIITTGILAGWNEMSVGEN